MEKMTQKELEEVQSKHIMWLENKPNGEKALFTDRGLKNKNLTRAIFARADLRHSQWTGCNFTSCDLQEADLKNAILSDCDLHGCNLEACDMRNIYIDRCSWPLWRGSLKAYVDDNTVLQLLFHALSLAQHSPYVSKALKADLLTKETVYIANRYFRSEDYGYLEVYEPQKEAEEPECC